MNNLNPRKWFDRMQPQTLQIATWLLYINGFFALISIIDDTDYLGYIRDRWAIGILIGFAVIAANVLGGFLMANDRRLGYHLSLVAAFSPFVLRFLALTDLDRNSIYSISLWDKLTGGDTIGFLFEIALCALLLHPQSKQHQKIWFR